MPSKRKDSLNKGVSRSDEQAIVDRIFTAVMERRLAPNTKLSEPELCESFGVGRMHVRRALLLLANQGLVDLHSNRGAYIACPTPDEANEVFEARLMIEPNIVRSMALRADPAALRKLRKHIKREDAARQAASRSDIIRLSGEFHVELAQAQGNSVLTKMIRELVTRTSLIVGLFGSSRNMTCPESEHDQILEAIESGDSARAESLVCHHLKHIQSGLDLSKNKTEERDLVKILGGR